MKIVFAGTPSFSVFHLNLLLKSRNFPQKTEFFNFEKIFFKNIFSKTLRYVVCEKIFFEVEKKYIF